VVIGEDREDVACGLALQNLGQDAPRTDWDRMFPATRRGAPQDAWHGRRDAGAPL
jgi:hypothetical protein